MLFGIMAYIHIPLKSNPLRITFAIIIILILIQSFCIYCKNNFKYTNHREICSYRDVFNQCV